MSDVFVSYRAEDRRRVRPLVAALEAEGLSVWWDVQISGGDKWRASIEGELNAAKCVIVVWSKSSTAPDATFVRDEASRALERGVYLPVKVDDSRLPLGFGETQALALARWRGDREDPRYVEVVRRVRSIVEGNRLAPSRHVPAPVSRRGALFVGSAAIVAAVSGAGGWYFLHRPPRTTANSIAVLPFANLSGDPAQAYFSDGMAEELRTSLARLAGLKVVGRTSSEIVRNDDAEMAARKLAVANILIGSVRRSPSTVRVAAQLIDGLTGVQRWSQEYDRAPGDEIKIQTDIAESVAQALKIALGNTGRAVLTLGGTNNVDAQNLVLEADALLQSIFNEDRARRALELIDAAIALDPKYAGAHARKGVLLNTVSMFYSKNVEELTAGRSQALASANLAVALAPNLGWAHLALAQIKSGQLQMKSAWNEYRRALTLSPSDANLVRLYARFLAEIGRGKQALELADKAIALDPLSAESYNFRIFVLYHARQYAEAERTVQDLIKRSPRLYYPPIEHSYCLVMLDQLAAAKQSFARAPPHDPGRLAGEAILSAKTGDRKGALLAIDELEHLDGDNASYLIAEVYAQLADSDNAFAALDRAFETTDWKLINLLTDPMMHPIRHDPRLKAALVRLNYP